MRVYLATPLVSPYLTDDDFKEKPYVLQSFYAMSDMVDKRMGLCSDVMIDSGAFSLRSQETQSSNIYWDYVYKYADFIKTHDIKNFFELDIDNLVGYEEVKRYRKKLEQLTGKQPIVVWHPSRGMEEFVRHCEEYDYVALGGFAGATMKQRNVYKNAYPYFINTAHKHGSKIHGLGFTSFRDLGRCHFDSVDSTSWLSGCRYGLVHKFNGKTLRPVEKPKGMRMNAKNAVVYNFHEWIKFQKYAEVHL